MGSEWKEMTIGDVAEIIGGSTPSTKDPENFEGDIPWITPKDLSATHERYVSSGSRFITQKGLDSCGTKLVPRNSILLTTRAPIGYIAIAANPIATNQGFRSLIVKPEFDHEFVYYWLIANKEELVRHANGSTFMELAGSALKRIKIRVPPLAEQRRIAHILGTFDDKIELNRRMNATLEAMARALFQSWFVDFDPVRAKMDGRWRQGESLPGLPAAWWDLFPDRLVDSELGPIPAGWRVGTVGEVAEITSGKRPREVSDTSTNQTSIPLWGGNGPMGYVHEPLVSERLLLTGRVGTLGSVFRITEPIWPSDNTLCISPKTANGFEYIYFQLRRVDYQSLNRGSTQPLLTQGDLKTQVILIPAGSVLNWFSKFAFTLFHKIELNSKEIKSISLVRDLLLAKLISKSVIVNLQP